MRPTDILMQEHRVIEQVLSCLEKMAHRCHQEGKLDPSDAELVIEFLQQFADRCHHEKEESHFFPAMEARGFPRDGGPTGVMLAEHEEGRTYVRGMAEAIPSATESETSRARFTENAYAYIHLLRDHIQKEDHCLFTMANRAFTETEQRELATAFTQVQTKQMGKGTHEKYVRLANELADRYGVCKVAATDATGGCGCGH